MKKSASSTEENYLKSLFLLADQNHEVSVSDLSEALSVSNPTANSMVKRLSEKGWVEYRKYKPIRVTQKGLHIAASIIRKHRLTEMYLVEKMSFGWEEVHDIAEQMEHIESEQFFDRMDEILGSPVTDPHGSPIPDREGRIHVNNYKPLSSMKEGQRVMIKGLNDSSKEFLEYLNEKRIELGSMLKIIKVDSFDKTMLVQMKNGVQLILGSEACTRLLVAPFSPK
ncbi:MAG: metal-dependent transcriptional regulator [Flavobacteriales bacterium]|nr:metal-dependent transcriptional regulator [Flavobacteriales bacterium]